jgi:hypothetical protein
MLFLFYFIELWIGVGTTEIHFYTGYPPHNIQYTNVLQYKGVIYNYTIYEIVNYRIIIIV